MKDSHLVVRLDALGRTIDRITSYSINSAYLTSTDGFEFTAFDTDRSLLQNLECQPVELLVNGASQLIGRIDSSSVGDNGSAVTFRGRDYIADLVECNVDPALKIPAKMSIIDAFLLAMGPVGIYEVQDDADVALRNVRTGVAVGAKKKRRKRKPLGDSDIKPQPGQGLYDFCNKIAARNSCTIQPSDKRRGVVLAKPNYDQQPLYTISRYDDTTIGQSNNILKATCTRDYSRFPTFTMLSGHQAKAGTTNSVVTTTIDTLLVALGAGQFRPSALVITASGSGSGAKSLNKTLDAVDFGKLQAPEIAAILEASIHRGRRKPPAPGGTAFDVGKLYRLLYHRDTDAKDEDQLFQGAARAIAERLKDTLEYRATLRGHVDPESGAVWSVDTMVQVTDTICNVSEPLWIAERTLRFSPQEGAVTDIVCWRPGSFQIGSEE